jgi:kynurenine formamidase
MSHVGVCYQILSYPLREGDPVFPGNPPLQIKQLCGFDKGDSCNTYEFSVCNHNGTHIDAPRHYYREGRPVSTYEVGDLIFSRPQLVDIRKRPGELVEPDDFQGKATLRRETDILLLRTGFSVKRTFPSYLDGPVLTLEATRYIKAGCPALRCIGLDYLSITNPRFRDIGEAVHRLLLDDKPNAHAILIIEDMDLQAVDPMQKFERVFVVPWYIEGMDGGPCTVFGEYHER